MPIERVVYQLTVRTTIEVLTVGAMGLGAGLAWGGPGRFGAAGLASARLVPGGCYTWAVVIAGAGLLTMLGIRSGWRRRVITAGLFLQGLWYAFFDLSLWVTAMEDPRTPLTGCFVYLLLAVICAVLYAGGHSLEAIAKRPVT